ncbi:MAG: hypothetical protein COY80_01420 [Candidatus Pacebacteria bacterium CG_4_10_14_0_8_um_filter_42_14]|nr:MAG: hypothetical protein COY80_01420 [Candidatus Pacebacteria bacterium CG_4_10_14_0_8_um_filter_42_14]
MDNVASLKAVTAQLEDLAGELPLTKTAKDIVTGEGSPTAEILFIGEAPGYHESVERRPFVGRSGKLLRQIISEIDLRAEQYYISNIVKARPPENRDPTPEEILAYRPFLNKEIEIINPKLIVTLGRFSMAKFLSDVKISQVHGRLHQVDWLRKRLFVLPMYHPAAALRSTQLKETYIKDMKKIPKVLLWIKEQEDVETLAESVKSLLF